jgi:hypothetical protein
MFKYILAGLLAATPVVAEPTKGYYTMDSMGCMILQECTDGVEEVFSLLDISSQYENPEKFTVIADEFNYMLVLLNQVGSKVYLANEKYFPVGHRGVYHTVSNNFYLNKRYMHRPGALMSVMRHEGWHAAQDCMAGSIENNMIAIIEPEENVPAYWAEIAEKTYPKSSLPWEREAMWAGHTEGMTAHALEACATGRMWEFFEPTPMTREWLEENGYIKK